MYNYPYICKEDFNKFLNIMSKTKEIRVTNPPKEVFDKVNKLAIKNERKFTQQVIVMLKAYKEK